MSNPTVVEQVIYPNNPSNSNIENNVKEVINNLKLAIPGLSEFFIIQTNGSDPNTNVHVTEDGAVTLTMKCGADCTATSVSLEAQHSFNKDYVCRALPVPAGLLCANLYTFDWQDGSIVIIATPKGTYVSFFLHPQERTESGLFVSFIILKRSWRRHQRVRQRTLWPQRDVHYPGFEFVHMYMQLWFYLRFYQRHSSGLC